MERSDGTQMALCVGCGLQPIYNPKLGIAICPMCDGPVRYAGESAGTLEILPPLGKPKSKIVEVEMPYATKVLGQELETYMNIGMRYITTADVQRFEQLELTATEVGEMKELVPFKMPNPVVAKRIEQFEETKISLQQLEAMGADLRTVLGDKPEQMDYVDEEASIGEMTPQNMLLMPETGMPEGGMPEGGMPEGEFAGTAASIPEVAAYAPEAPEVQQPTILGGALPGNGSPKLLVIDTSPVTMQNEAARLGLPGGPQTMGGARRQFRRAPAYGGYSPMPGPIPGFGGAGAPIAMVPGRTETTETGEVIKLGPSAPVLVQKLG
jgi:hypothetical protein